MLKMLLLCLCFCFGVVFSCHDTCPVKKPINITCNTCNCHNGMWGCSKAPCHTTECDPYQYRNCNNCVCRKALWECNGCPTTCGGNCPICKQIKIGCNSCTCRNGIWRCTKIRCSYKECDPKQYRRDCDRCECKNGRWKCKGCKHQNKKRVHIKRQKKEGRHYY